MMNAPTMFNIPQGQGLFYKFGAQGQLHKIGTTTPLPRIVETIKTHLELTPPRHSLVYCGWELLDCLPELWGMFPNATYLIPTAEFLENNWEDWLAQSHNQVFIKESEFPTVTKPLLDIQLNNINEFLKNKEHRSLRDDPTLKNKVNFKNFKGICVQPSRGNNES
jgi:hypothetical protein